MRSTALLILVFACVFTGAATLTADDAADALRRGRVYGNLYGIAAPQWERVYSFALRDLKGLSRDRYAFAKENLVPAFVFSAGRGAFHGRSFKLAGQRFSLAMRLASDSGAKDLAKEAGLWRLACEVALKTQDAMARFNKADVEAETPHRIFLLAYLLDRLGVELEGKRKGLYYRGVTAAKAAKLSPMTLRHRAWLAYRIEGDAKTYLKTASLGPDFPAKPWKSAAKGASAKDPIALRRVTSIEIYDASRLYELSMVYARRAYDLAPASSEIRVRAALRLGLYDEARRRAHQAASRTSRSNPEEALQAYNWRIVKAAADYGSGRRDALVSLGKRFVNPAFAEQNKQIYHAVAYRLAQAMIDAGLNREALGVARDAVGHLEKNYKAGLTSGQLLDYYEQTRPIYAVLADACFRNGDVRTSFDIYGLVYPWHRGAWLNALRSDPLFCVRYSALLFERRDYALARELLYNYRSYGLLAVYPHARQIHSVSAALEYLYR